MERGAETQGQVARLMAGVGSVEIKATVPEKQVEAALARYQLKPGDDDQRFVYFFDTPALSLYEAGVIARARRVVGGEHDSTVKFRPVDPETVPATWRKYKGFKIEADASEKGVVKSASLTMPVKKGQIKRVAAGAEPIATLFAAEQLAFLLAMANRHLDFAHLEALGPIRAWRWKFSDPALPWPITGELWQREDGARLLEASIKVPVVQAACASAGFIAFLAEGGAERDISQQTKTRWALDFLARQIRLPPKG